MQFDIARQPLVPAFVTLAALVVTAMCHTDAHALLPAAPHGAVRPEGLALPSPGELLTQFQLLRPVWAHLLAGFLLLYTGMVIGRLTIRYNLYAVGTCLAIPLYAIAACGIALSADYLPAAAASALLALSVKHFCRSFCNGYGFDALFRASACLGLLVLVSAAAAPLLLMLPFAVLLFRRTVRECVVAVAGLLLPLLAVCYVNWGAGGDFTAPILALADAFLAGAPLALFRQLPMQALAMLGGITLLTLLAVLFFLADFYAAGTKPRFLLIFHIGVLLLTLAQLFGPAASAALLPLTAVPAAVLLPLLFVRIHRTIALPLYLILLAAAFAAIILQ